MRLFSFLSHIKCVVLSPDELSSTHTHLYKWENISSSGAFSSLSSMNKYLMCSAVLKNIVGGCNKKWLVFFFLPPIFRLPAFLQATFTHNTKRLSNLTLLEYVWKWIIHFDTESHRQVVEDLELWKCTSIFHQEHPLPSSAIPRRKTI